MKTIIQHHFHERYLIIKLFGRVIYRENITEKIKPIEIKFDFSKFKIHYATHQERFEMYVKSFGGGLIWTERENKDYEDYRISRQHHRFLKDWGLIYFQEPLRELLSNYNKN